MKTNLNNKLTNDISQEKIVNCTAKPCCEEQSTRYNTKILKDFSKSCIINASKCFKVTKNNY